MPVTPPPSIPFFPAFTTAVGTFIQAGCRIVSYVRSTGAQSGDDITIGNNLDLTLAAGLAKCSRAGDTVLCLPGHTENVTTTPTFPAGCRVVGVPAGTSTPTFTWTGTGSQWAISTANVILTGLRLAPCGADGVVKAIAVTGANCSIVDNTIITATGAALKAAIVVEAGTGAHEFKFNDNKVQGTATHNSDDVVLIAGAITNWEVCRNRIICSCTAAAKGHVDVTGVALNGLIADNYMLNTMTSSVQCVYMADVASDGLCVNNRFGVKVGTGTAPAATGIVLAGTNTLWTFDENYSTPTKNTSGLVAPVVDS